MPNSPVNNNLPISNVVNITVIGVASGLGAANMNSLCIISSETPQSGYSGIDYKVYKNPSEVKTDWGSASHAYALSLAIFSQQPNILSAGGYLVIVPLENGESIADAVERVKDQVFFFGVIQDDAVADIAADATYIQTLDKMMFYASPTEADIQAAGQIYVLVAAGKTHTRGLFYSTSQDTANLMAAAYASRALSVDFSGSNTCITMDLKSLATIDQDTLITQTILTEAGVAGAEVYVSLEGVPVVYTSGANGYFDEIYNELWFKLALKTQVFNYLRQLSTKIPQTETGMDGLKGSVARVCRQAINNGFIAPGTWDSAETIGNPDDLVRNIKDFGFYIYSDPVSKQLTADRLARKAPLIQVAIKSAGAIQRVNVVVNVNL